MKDRWELSGHWIATRLYSPELLPLRIMEAVGLSPRDCIRQLQDAGLDPTEYHYELLTEPYGESER